MRITLRLVLAFLAAMSAIFVIYGWFSHRRIVDYFEADARGEEHALGHAIGEAVVRTWRNAGPAEALALIDAMSDGQRGVLIRWVWLDPNADEAHRPVVGASELRELGTTRETVRHKTSSTGENRLYTYLALPLDPQRPGALEISQSSADDEAFARSSLTSTAVTLAIMGLVCTAVLGALGVWLIGWPLRELVGFASRIGLGDLSNRLTIRRQNEVSELAAEMNHMCDRLQGARERIAVETNAKINAVEQLRHADRLSTVGTLASGIAHELGSPLQVVLGRARMISDDPASSSRIADQARAISNQAERMSVIVRQLLDFARQRRPQKGDGDLAEVARESVKMLQPLAAKRGVTLELDAADAVVTAMDAAQIQQVLTNLVMNAIQASPRGGRVVLHAGHGPSSVPPDRGGGTVETGWVRVEDHGAGIAAEHLRRVFEPFFTTKDVGEGTGLGLPVAHGIVREHGGWIAVESQLGEGTTFGVYLPQGAP